MGDLELDDLAVDWATVAAAYPGHPAGMALVSALKALSLKRTEAHDTLDRLQVLKCRLSAATALALGVGSINVDEMTNADRVESLLRRKLNPGGTHDEAAGDVQRLHGSNDSGADRPITVQDQGQ